MDLDEQLTLLRPVVRRPRPAATPAKEATAAAAAVLPVAQVAVDVSLAHLDRLFDFLVPESMSAVALPGVRVRVRFAGRLVSGYVVARVAASEHLGRLGFLDKVVSPEPVLTPALLALCRQVADRYAGTLADVLRLAVPPRHARVEKEQRAPASRTAPARPDSGSWERYDAGSGLLAAVHAEAPVRAVWTALPGGPPDDWPTELATMLTTCLAAGRGALLVVPDQRDVDRADGALQRAIGAEHHVVLTADLGPAERYRRWLRVLRGEVRGVIGTRAAMFAPVRHLGLVAVWDDGDDLHAEPRAPYPHVRTVLSLRSAAEGAAFVVGGLSRTAEGAALVRSGWARSVTAPRTVVRRVAPTIQVEDGSGGGRDSEAGPGGRLPGAALRVVREGLRRGPVLVQVPRAGYLPGLVCTTCRVPARCPACEGPLGRSGPGGKTGCRWCGRLAGADGPWVCKACGGGHVRASVVGSGRTAEELVRAFPRTRVVVSAATGDDVAILAEVPDEPILVVATPGTEPPAVAGYAAALLMDGWSLLSRPDLRAAEEALRRWTAAAALVRGAGDGGQVLLLADGRAPAVQALVRWDHAGFAERELAERAALRLPPEARMASLTGDRSALAAFLTAAALPPGADILGPVPAGENQRFLVRAPQHLWAGTVHALTAAAALRSAHKDGQHVRIQVDPREIA